MWFPLERRDASYLSRSPFHIDFVAVMQAPPERVFDVFAEGEGMREWFNDFVGCTFTSPAPHGVGTTREVELKLLSVKERFVAFERGARIAFVMDAISLPLVKAMAEDFRLERAGEGTRVTWTVHYTPTLLTRLVHPIARAVFSRMFQRSLDGLALYVGAPAKSAA